MAGKLHVAVRLDEETVVRIDSLRSLLDMKWRAAKRSDVLRLLILHGLERMEQEHGAALAAASTQKKRQAKAPAKRSQKKSPPPVG